MSQELLDAEQEALLFKPEEWGMTRQSEQSEFMFLNLGPNHPSVHGVFRIALQLDGEVILDAEVASIDVDGKKVTGIELSNGERIEAKSCEWTS